MALSWFNIARPVWMTLLIGVLLVVASIAFSFEEPSSGALLLCCCLIAEIQFNGLIWYKMARFAPPEGSAKTREPGDLFYEVGKGIRVSSPEPHPLDLLQAVARSPHVSCDGKTWSISGVTDLVEKVVHGTISFLAILASLLWGVPRQRS